MAATLTNEHRWSDEVLLVAAGVERTHGISRVQAIDVARRRVLRRGGRIRTWHISRPPVDLTGDGEARPGWRVMWLELGDATAWVWARV